MKAKKLEQLRQFGKKSNTRKVGGINPPDSKTYKPQQSGQQGVVEGQAHRWRGQKGEPTQSHANMPRWLLTGVQSGSVEEIEPLQQVVLEQQGAHRQEEKKKKEFQPKTHTWCKS